MTRGHNFLLAYHAIGNNELGGYVFHGEIPYSNLDPKERRSAIIKKILENSTQSLREL